MAATTTHKIRRSRKVEERHALEALIPEEWMATEYVSREVHGVTDAKLLHKAMEMMHNVIIYGPTGSAKTSLVYAYAAGFTGATRRARNKETGEMESINVIDRSKRRPLIYVPCNGAVTPDILFGRHVPQTDGGLRFVLGDLPLALIHGGIIYLDEVNFLSIKIAAVVHGLLDKRRTVIIQDAAGAGICSTCGYTNPSSAYHEQRVPTEPLFTCEGCGVVNYTDTVFVASEETQIIAAYNPGYRGTNPLNEAFLNRFAIKIPFPYDQKVEEQMLYSGRLIELANQLRSSYATGEIATPVSTSMLIEFEQFALDSDLGYGFAVENFLSSFDETDRPSVAQHFRNNSTQIMSDLFDDDEPDDDIDLSDLVDDTADASTTTVSN